ncbi:FecR family protein [Mucilaginibacter hurinus]|nr:FecR domain-containing protein [Mucilaginibacter hurinus]
MEKEQLKDLFKKYHDGTCTEDEKALLEAWYLHFNEQEPYLAPRKIGAIAKKVYRELPGNETAFLKIGLKLAAAAVTIGILFTAVLYMIVPDKDNSSTTSAEVILPGSDQAILTLSNGHKVDLTLTSTGHIANNVTKANKGQVVYTDVLGEQKVATGQNNLTTPKGGQWQLILPDGSKVWLNANTSLDFPASFKNQAERTVYLEGEAYFEIAKDKAHPFIVKTRQQSVTVLGTHFNINSYADEPSVKTTLAEGKIQIATSNGSKKILVPGEQAFLSGNNLTVSDADIEESLAWKNGYFRFNDEDIHSIMRKLSRWYNVEVTYTPDAPDQRLNGKISRAKNIDQVLKALEATQTVHFKVEGRRVILMK